MIYVVTNRNLQNGKQGIETFGPRPNPKGDDQLRLAKASKSGDAWTVEVLADKKTAGQWPSEQCFLELQQKMSIERRNCVFFVHGYYTSFEQALERAQAIQDNYQVEVVVFTWPSDGKLGGYKSDQRDAVRSIGALDRAFEKLATYLRKHTDTACNQHFTMILHSMANYLLKHLLKSSVYSGETLLFENIILAAADVNAPEHEEWVDRIAVRKRLYITINENDYALNASRVKTGPDQLVRLGHTTQNLASTHAVYLDFTEAAHIGDAHAHFVNDGHRRPLDNANVKAVFKTLLTGGIAESGQHAMQYDVHTRAYRVA